MNSIAFGIGIGVFSVIVSPFYFTLFSFVPADLALSLNIKMVSIVFQIVASVITIAYNLILLTDRREARKSKGRIQAGVILGFVGFVLGFVFLASWFNFLFSRILLP